MPRKIYIVEDHPIFREGLSQILTSESDLAVCGMASNAADALREIPRLKPDLVLVDLGLPGKSGLELIRNLRAKDKAIKILVVSMHDEAVYAQRVLKAGGDGYIMKEEPPEELIQAIRDVLSGHIYVSEAVLAGETKTPGKRRGEAKSKPLDRLTDLELEILQALGQGKSVQEIAKQLKLKRGTIDSHCTQMRKKLGLKTINSLIRYAVCWVEGDVR